MLISVQKVESVSEEWLKKTNSKRILLLEDLMEELITTSELEENKGSQENIFYVTNLVVTSVYP